MKLKSLSQKDRYGNMFSFEFFEPDASIPMMMVIPDMADGYNGADTSNHPGEPKGTDTVPAWLTPGENVVNAEASRLPGNQEKIDEMNEQGRAVQQAQGGPIPTYAAGGMEVPRYDGMLNSLGQRLGDRDGGPMYSAVGSKVPSWLTDEVLDSLKMVESSGDPMATSEVGAQGLYQIMPATAQQPGMNVPPLAIEDIRDPAKSREFARNYLTGIASANPDFTPEEVLTAYHSGAGNVRKAKAGTEALGPRGQAYAGKIMDNMSNPDKFGVTRRKVVGNVPAPTAAVPEPIDFSQYSDPVTGPRVPTQIAGSEDQRIRDEAILAESLANERSKIAAIDDAGLQVVPKPEVDLGDPEATTLVPVDPLASVAETQAAEAAAIEVMETGTRATNAAAAAKAERERLRKLIETNANASLIAKQTETTKAANANEIAAKEANDKALAQQEDQNKKKAEEEAKLVAEAKTVSQEVPKSDDDAPPKPKDTTETTQKKNAAGMVMQQLGPVNEITLEGEAGINQLINSLPENPEVKSKFDEVASEVGGWFKDTFASMFSGPEIARMLVTYAGSRIMGYDHGDSLNYSMKNYVERIDAQEKQYQEDIRSKDYQDFTEASRKEFEKTRDYSVLKEKPASLNIKKATGSFYVTGVGQMQAWEDDKGVQYIKVPGGGYKKASELGDLVQPYDKDVFGDKAVISSFSNYAEAAVAPANDKAGLTADEKNLVKINKQKIGEEANSIYRNILRSNGININNSDRIRQGIQAGIDSYMDAQAQYNKSGKKGTTPGNLESYIREQMITPLTGIDQVQITGTSPQNLKKLDDSVRRDMDIKNPRDPGYAEEYRAEWQAINLAWAGLSDAARAEAVNQARKRNEKAETSQWSAFTWWAANTPADEINALIAGKK